MFRLVLGLVRWGVISAAWVSVLRFDADWIPPWALAVATAWALWSAIRRQVRRHDKVVLLRTIHRLASDLEMQSSLRRVK